MASDEERPTVLVIDDERRLADVYAMRLEPDYETMVAYGGREGLEMVDDDVDVVLLDRRMPGPSGDEVLATLRDRNVDCRVIMLTAVNPDFEIVDMPFDDYLHKPIDTELMKEAIERQLAADEYGDSVRGFVELTSKISVLEQMDAPGTDQDADLLRELKDQVDDLETELDAPLSQLRSEQR